MIADILFEWNVLTSTIVAWLACVSLALAADFGPEIYRERKAHSKLAEGMARIAERKIATPSLDPDMTMQLGVFKIQPEPARRRHARA